MYKCLDCGKEFEHPHEYEECVGCFWGDPAYQTFKECPHCGGDYEEMKRCAMCGESYLEEDLTNGYCEYCMKNEINYDSALRYFKNENLLRDFFFVYYWQMCESMPDMENQDLDDLLILAYNQKVLYDKETGKTIFLQQLMDYVLKDIYCWTEFLEKEVNVDENTKG